MHIPITSEQAALYQEQGFLVIEDLLSPAQLHRWRSLFDEAVEQRLRALADGLASGRIQVKKLDRYKSRLRQVIGKQQVDRLRRLLVRTTGRDISSGAFNDFLLTNQGDPDSYYAQVLVVCQRLADTHEGICKIARDGELGAMAARLGGVDAVRYYHDQALIKPPFGNPTAWHIDNTSWSFHGRDAMTLWIALDDATPSNGCVWYLPGTHKTATTKNVNVAASQGDLFNLYPEWRKITPVPCVLPAGSAVLHNGYIAHGAGANMTNQPRRAFTISYMPDGAVFNGNKDVLPPGYFRALKHGDRLDDDMVFPLIRRADKPVPETDSPR